MNQRPQTVVRPERQRSTTGKRIVSKGRYVCVQAERAFWWLDSLLCYLGAFLCLLIILSFACGVLHKAPWPMIREIATTQQVWLLLFSPALIYVCFAVGAWCVERSDKIEPVIPFMAWTRNSLSAPDSLVRASSQPTQEQQAVLLRPVESEPRTPPEQLIRPAHKLAGHMYLPRF